MTTMTTGGLGRRDILTAAAAIPLLALDGVPAAAAMAARGTGANPGLADFERRVRATMSAEAIPGMDAAMSQLQYSEVESGILPWIDKNAALNGLFQDLATATDATGLANCKAAILDVLDGSITSAPSAWNNALGGDGTTVNLIEAW